MHQGQLVFSQLMRHLPPTTFRRCVVRYAGEHKVKSFGIALGLYAEQPFGVDLAETVCALDATTIDLCLSVFPWAPFRSAKAAVKLHTLLDLRGNIPSFIHIADGKMHYVNVLDLLLPEPGAYYVMDPGLSRLRAAVPPARARQLLRHARQVKLRGRAPLFPSGGPGYRADLRSNGHLEWLLFAQRVSRSAPSHQVHRSEVPQTPRILDQSVWLPRIEHRRLVSLPLAGGAFLQMDQAAPADQGVLLNFRVRSEDTDLYRHLRLCPGRYRQKQTCRGRCTKIYRYSASLSARKCPWMS